MTFNPRVDNRSGFTTVELLLVLVLMAVLAGLGQPSFMEYVGRQKTRSALDRIVADIALARSVAVRSGTRTELLFTSATDYQVLRGSAGLVVKKVSLARDYQGVQVAAPTADGRLAFNPRGLVLNLGNGLVIATLGSSADTVQITPTGRAYRVH